MNIIDMGITKYPNCCNCITTLKLELKHVEMERDIAARKLAKIRCSNCQDIEQDCNTCNKIILWIEEEKENFIQEVTKKTLLRTYNYDL